VVDQDDTDPQNPDTDKDGLWDGVEPIYGTDPTNPDCDGDALLDGREVEVRTDPRNPDCDGDGLLDGQEAQKNQWDWCYTGSDPLKRDTDGDGIGDYQDDEDKDGLPNGEEWKYDSTNRNLPVGWTDPRGADSDGDGVLDGAEVYGNPKNKMQNSNPLKKDTDDDRLTDDIDPRTWIKDYLPFSRVRGQADQNTRPVYPASATKGLPFNVEGNVEYNSSCDADGNPINWGRIRVPMKVQIWVDQDGVLIPISDAVVTGNYGAFKISCTIGDNVKAGSATLVITTTIYQSVAYLPVLWDEIEGNHL